MWQFYVYIHYIGPYQYIGMSYLDATENRLIGRGKHNDMWNRCVKKYGLLYEILAHFKTRKDAEDFEIAKIKEIGRYDLGLGPLLNQTDGGEWGPGPQSGTKHPLYGKKRNPIIAQKMIQTKKARGNLTGHKAWNKNKKCPQIGRKGREVWNTGIHIPGKKVLCVELNKEFISCGQAAKWCNKSGNNLAKAAKNPKLTCGGYHWKFILE